MNEILNKFGNAASPELIVVVLLVWLFLDAQRKRDKAQENRDLLFINSIRAISDQHVEAREQSRRVIEQNSVHTVEATKAMVRMTEALHAISPPQKCVDS